MIDFFPPIKGWKQPIMNEQQLAVKKLVPFKTDLFDK